jgi:amino acid transporter
MAKQTPRKLKLWEALALSVGLMGPTLAMGLNGPGVAATAGKAVPLVFVLGLIGVGLVGYGFWRLTQHFNHAGSVYALAGATIGPRAGFFGGFALLGTYIFFLICTNAAAGVFANAFLQQLGVHDGGPWIIFAILTAIGISILNVRDTRITARTLLAIEGLGILAMLVLALVIVGGSITGTGHGSKGGGPAQFDLSTFTSGGTTWGAIMTATVFAFLSWAGFEACASLGEETDDPKRNIPRALVGSVILTGLLYVLMMFTETIGFGTDEAGVKAFSEAESPLSTLSDHFIGTWFGLIVAFTAVASAFASSLSSSAAASRMVYALARDGFGPKRLAAVDERTGVPRQALIAAVGVTLVADIIVWLSGVGAFDAYYWFATLGVLCILVAYAVVGVGVIVLILKRRGPIRMWEAIFPTVGILYLLFVFYKQSTGQEAPYSYFPWIAGVWCLIGVIVIFAAPGLTSRIGQRLTRELTNTGSDVDEMVEADQ